MHGPNGINCENREKLTSGGELFHASTESVSSTEDVPNFAEVYTIDKPQLKKKHHSKVVCGLLVGLFAVLVFLLVIGDQDNHNVMVPT